MVSFLYRISPLFFFVLFSLVLSGCISTKQFCLVDETTQKGQLTTVSEPADDEVQLRSTETDATLHQELDALSKTGKWGEQTAEQREINDSIQADFPVIVNTQVQMYLDLFENKWRRSFELWMARSGRYMPMMQSKLKDADLPSDLAYLSMIESGYDQLAYSRSKAVGLWQFMAATGKEYDLVINKHMDERRDAEKSTDAAIAFLKDLHSEFGDWHLAVAAYNAGPGKIRSGLRKYKVDNFWDLAQCNHLRLETKRYVPKLIAVIMIAREPEKYGFTNLQFDPPMTFDTLEVGPSMSLEAIAVVSETDLKTIKQHNLELRKNKTPANDKHYLAKIPKGTGTLAVKNLDRLHRYVSTGYKSHRVRNGETVKSISRKYNINTTTLLTVNHLSSNRIRTGSNLRIPYSTIKYQLLAENGKQTVKHRENLTLHQIRSGETISKIAEKYGVPPEMIVEWNGLESVHKIRAGQQLALYIHYADKGQVPRMVAVTRKIIHDPPLSSQELAAAKADGAGSFKWYTIQNGDSLWTISRKFNTSAAEIRKLNNLKSNLIHPGNRIKVKSV